MTTLKVPPITAITLPAGHTVAEGSVISIESSGAWVIKQNSCGISPIPPEAHTYEETQAWEDAIENILHRDENKS